MGAELPTSAATLADEIVLLAGGQVKAVGDPRNILKDDLLSAAYGCKVLTNRSPGDGRPFVLPPAVFSMLDIVRRPAK
jgi:iron complex transport system ATP-binding protein